MRKVSAQWWFVFINFLHALQISLPDENGRVQILRIHTSKMTKSGLLDTSVSLQELAQQTKNFSGGVYSRCSHTNTHAHTRTRAQKKSHTRAHAHAHATHTRTHINTHALTCTHSLINNQHTSTHHTHTHTHMCIHNHTCSYF